MEESRVNSANKPAELIVNETRYPGAGVRVLDLHADFECGCCGACCCNSWQIRPSAAECERISGKLAQAAWPPENYFEFLAQEGGKPIVCLAKSAEGKCLFLGAGEGAPFCRLQREFGHAILPAVCQGYPRLAIATPAGVRLTLSYTCPAAARTLLASNGLRETHPRKLMQGEPRLQGISVREGDRVPKFAGKSRPSWAALDYFWRWTAEVMNTPGLSPAQALWYVSLFIEQIEANAQALRELPALMDGLEQIQNHFTGSELFGMLAAVEPHTNLGTLYFGTLLNILVQTGSLSGIWRRAWELLNAEGRRSLEALSEPWDRIMRPRVGEFAAIERNYLASRLYANPYAYRAGSLRMGYFFGLMHFVAYRFSALMLHLEEGCAVDEELWLRAAGMADGILQHNEATQGKILKLIEPYVDGPLMDLSRVALF